MRNAYYPKIALLQYVDRMCNIAACMNISDRIRVRKRSVRATVRWGVVYQRSVTDYT